MFREGLRPPDPFQQGGPLEEARTQDGMSLAALCQLGPALLICLPPLTSWAGTRLLKTIAAERSVVEERRIRIVLVHAEPEPEPVLERFDLQYVARVHDPEQALAAHFGFEGKRRAVLLGEAELPGGSKLARVMR